MRILLFFLFIFPLLVFAQKPTAVRPFEIKLSAENADWYLKDNLRISAATGYPEAIYQAGYAVSPADPESMARTYLMANQSLLGLETTDLDNLKLHAIRTSQTGHTVRLRQEYKGLPVNKNAEITIHITNNNVVDFVMNGFRYGVQMEIPANLSVNPSIARTIVVDQLNLTGTVTDEINQLMILNHENQNYLVHRISFLASEPLGEWEAYVDALTGEIRKLEDVSFYHQSSPEDPGVPPAIISWMMPPVNGTGNVFNPDPLSTATTAYAGSYVDGNDATNASLDAEMFSLTLLDITETAGTYSLVGPYAEIRDFETPNKGLFSQGSSTFNFNRNADAFEAVNTYYHIDNLMRYLNITLGLSIMPYQYVGGVRFDPSGLNGADNSHYVSGTGQLSLGEGGVDDAEDADVIIHELGHGLHDWITAGGLSQVNGLSEGLGDYVAGSYSRALGDWTSSDAAYHWVFNWDGHNPFWGGRVLNYGAIYPVGLTGAIHTDGQIWATAMMRVWDDIGRQNADKAFWLGIDVTNSSTNQNDAANAVYQAAINLGYSNADLLAIHTRFTAAGYTLPPFVLPVELLQFEAVASGGVVLLNWATATEKQNDYFTVEKSTDSRNFLELGQIKGAGDSQVENHYSMTDPQPVKGVNYYRLKQTDYDGGIVYSDIVPVRFEGAGVLSVFPNPASESITILHPEGAGIISIYGTEGKLLFTQTIDGANAKSGYAYSLSGLSNGMYWIQWVSNGEVLTSKFYKS